MWLRELIAEVALFHAGLVDDRLLALSVYDDRLY
jgi:hypothetical protein